MAIITSGLLKILQQLIGAPAAAWGPVVLDDDSVAQTLPIIPEIARRGLAPGTIGGWGFSVMENVHAGAGFEFSTIDPYQPGVAAVGGYPEAVQEGFDVWLLGATGLRSSGAGGLTVASVALNLVGTQQMWGVDDADAQVVADPLMVLGRFDGLETTLSGGSVYMIDESGNPYISMNLRIPRSGVALQFHTEAAAAAEFQLVLLMGLFPASLGQDIVT